MELRVLHYFLAVAREQSISGAAETLHLSQPTLSTQLKALEDELGKQLLIRGSKGSRKVTLTEEGMILRRRAEEIFDLVHKTENEITSSDEAVEGDVFIGAGESDVFRLVARAADRLHEEYPGVHFRVFSGNANYVLEQLNKGLVDFGMVYGAVDNSKYEYLPVPVKDTFGVLMRKDSPLAEKEFITPEDLADKPLIISHQEGRDGYPLVSWINKDITKLNIIATYNLLFNGSILVEEGLGYAIGFDKLINTSGESSLCFRPMKPAAEVSANIVWKRYQVFTKAAEKFLEKLREVISEKQQE